MSNSEMKERKFLPDFFQQHNLYSFVKASLDGAGIGKMHLSFVQHSGRPECAQRDTIEFYLSPEKCMAFTQFVLSGAAKKRRDMSVKEAEQKNEKYAADIWSLQAGTPEKWAKDRPLEWRQLSLAPGAKNNKGMRADFVLKASKALGESVPMGGVQKKAGAYIDTIMVQFSASELVAMCRLMEMHWQVVIDQSYGAVIPPDKVISAYSNPSVQPSQKEAQPLPASTPKQPATYTAYVMYDSSGLVFNVAIGCDQAKRMIKDMMAELVSKHGYKYCVKEEYGNAVAAIDNEAKSIPIIQLVNKQDATKTNALCIRQASVNIPV